MVRLAVLDSRVNIWMTEQHISSNFSARDCHSVTCVQQCLKKINTGGKGKHQTTSELW